MSQAWADMKLGDPRKAFLVPEGGKVKLTEEGADELKIFPKGGKSDGEQLFLEILQKIKAQQKVLYAQGKHRVLVIIQAMDTGGKDGCVKSVFSTVDPAGISVKSFKKPNEEDLAHDFLWRVHPHVPGNGEITVFNRSHYEDIIAVRVKKLYDDSVWKRRYRHVIEFERMLAEEGTTILKIFLHISKAEQKRRLEARLKNPAKHWKFHPDDLADRERWECFQNAYEDLIERTSTEHAPWYVIPADRKWFRNLAVAQLFSETLQDLDLTFPKVSWDAEEIRISD
ncbi:PPK2 family polyphosphate:nucleotide phosphotransferase [Haloferula luteola]|uniref:PPK2 family polyphosphate:nucleotide phosphotransferase n=1 Tax=Haloferula luteola TaxID=595692 RepID=A0A840UZI0_9BACT|nr:PPK2 family polyphosphate kinase [Haloferula luteola]MBB5351182.1 PPK2 family polyphosphate:nucleotide phosphotransferase [Haloferula luteola]